MIFLTYLLRVLLSVLADIVGVVVVPVALLHGGLRYRLPAWAAWWDNDREPFGDLSRRPAIAAAYGLRLFWLRYLWLGWRNPANNFGRIVGLKQTAALEYRLWGNPNTSDQGEQGWKFVLARCSDCKTIVGFEFYAVWAWSDDRCLRLRLGWKIDHNAIFSKVTDGAIASIVHVFNPLMTFTGRR